MADRSLAPTAEYIRERSGESGIHGADVDVVSGVMTGPGIV
jgi:hypothetical protein